MLERPKEEGGKQHLIFHGQHIITHKKDQTSFKKIMETGLMFMTPSGTFLGGRSLSCWDLTNIVRLWEQFVMQSC